MGCLAAGVSVLCVRDDSDDIGLTVTTLASVSLDPPLALVSVDQESYLAEVLTRADRWAVTMLAAPQRRIASRFAAAGRPSARLLLADEPHHRGVDSGALIPECGLAAFECRSERVVGVGDHLLVIGRAVRVDYLDERGAPLIYLHGRYTDIAAIAGSPRPR